jgi:integrase
MVERAAPEPERDLFIWDSKVPGFGVRVYPSGKRMYLFQYRLGGRAGRQRRMTIGLHGPFSVDEARNVAADLYQAARKGRDPVEEQRAAERVQRTTIESVVDEFMTRHMVGKHRTRRYIEDTRRQFDKYVLPYWRGRDLREITRRDVIGLLDRIVDQGKPSVANRTLTSVRKLFNWALQRGIIDTSSVVQIEKPAEERRRERILSSHEIRAVWAAAGTLGYPYRQFFRLALVLGQRRDEVAGMKWAEINAGERVWTLAGDRTKGCRAHVVPLPTLAVEILGEVPRGLGEWVFTTLGARPISGYSAAKVRLDLIVAKAQTEVGEPDLEPWRIHDLRRTVGTGLGKLGTPRFIIARVLNHADRTVTGIYDRYEYLEEKRKALGEWGEYLESLVRRPAEAVQLRA